MYLTQLTFRENLNFDIFCKKMLFQTKTAITFTYELEKMCNIWKIIYTKSYIRFQRL
jgi:hypothetical protein